MSAPRRFRPLAAAAPRWALCAAAFALAAGCASSGAVDDPRAGGGLDGDARMAAGDFEGAAVEYERQLRRNPESPVLQEKLLNARRRAAQMHAQAALRAADEGDGDRARAELARAEQLGGDVLSVRSTRQELDARLAGSQRSAELRSQAKGLLASDPEQAERLLDEARAQGGFESDRTGELSRLAREATLRAEAERSSRRATAAWEAGDRARAIAELASAEFAGHPVPSADALRARVERDLLDRAERGDDAAAREALEMAMAARLRPSTQERLREALVDRLLARAAQLRAARQPSVAALLELEASRARAGIPTPALDQVREDATITLVVHPFSDATGGEVDGARLARAVRERLSLDAAGGGLALRVIDGTSDPVQTAARPRALHLRGEVLSQRRTGGRVGRETQRVAYQTGSVRRPNPEYADVVERVAQASDSVRTARLELEDAQAWLARLRQLPFHRTPSGPPVRTGDAYYQTQVAAALARVDRAEREVQRARDAEFAVRQQAQVVPSEVDEPVWGEHLLTVTTMLETAELTVRLEVRGADEVHLSQDVTASAEHRETVAEAFAPAGLAADPDDTPDDAEMAARAADRFAAVAAGRIRAAAEGAARHFLVDARAAERAGQRDAAAEAYAMYLLATPDVISPQRADAARALAEIANVRVPLRTGAEKERP